MELLFWVSLAGSAYSYVGYPLLLATLVRGRQRLVTAPLAHFSPTVTIVVAAYNEAHQIERKIANIVATEYPRDLLELIVVSDGSTDGTDRIVERHADKGVKLLSTGARVGKERAQRLAIDESRGEILVFSDAAASLAPDAVAKIVANFANAQIGAVSSVDRFVGRERGVAGEGLYVRYEMWLRDLESRFGSLVGLSGSFFAARREICEMLDVRMPSDFAAAINSVRRGYKAVSDRSCASEYLDAKHSSAEYRRKVRTILRGMNGLKLVPQVLNPLRFGSFAFQVFSHKVMRWASGWFMLTTLLSNLFLIREHAFFSVFLGAQVGLVAAGVTGNVSIAAQRLSFVRMCAYVVQVSSASVHASLLFLLGKNVTQWEPTRR